MDACTTLVRGRSSRTFRVAEAIHASYGSPVRVELSGRRYRPAASRGPTMGRHPGTQQQGRWEADEKEAPAHSEVVILLGGGDGGGGEAAVDLKSSLIFHLHRESLTADDERALRERGTVVVPRLLLRSMEEIAADSLSNPHLSLALADPDGSKAEAAAQEVRADWKHRLLGSWERILGRMKEDQCTAREAAVHLAAEGLVDKSKARLTAATNPSPPPERTSAPDSPREY